jgi:uncharacterized membrane protein
MLILLIVLAVIVLLVLWVLSDSLLRRRIRDYITLQRWMRR